MCPGSTSASYRRWRRWCSSPRARSRDGRCSAGSRNCSEPIFIDRQARHQTGAATREIAGRLLGGDAVVLFAEGTSSDGTRVLPFRSCAGRRGPSRARQLARIIPASPCSRCRWPMSGSAACRSAAACANAWLVRRRRPDPASASRAVVRSVDVTVSWGEAIAYDMSADRKAIARDAEKSVRRMTAAALRAAPPATSAASDRGAAPEPALNRPGVAMVRRALRPRGARATIRSRLALHSHRIDPCKFAISAAPACAFPPSASAATISASAPISKPRAR